MESLHLKEELRQEELSQMIHTNQEKMEVRAAKQARYSLFETGPLSIVLAVLELAM